MTHVLVIGSVNIDRVWFLDAPLIAGRRLTCHRIETRCGGGGFNTGATLLALGHRVTLVSTLADDETGRVCFDILRRHGFEIGEIRFEGRGMRPLDILVDPVGERTIISPASSERRIVTELPTVPADFAYISVRRADPAPLVALAARMPVVAQVPLELGQQRPAHVLIAAASDQVVSIIDPFADARRIGGPLLQTLLLTDGAGPVQVWREDRMQSVPVPPISVQKDTTGAGDAFAAGYIDAFARGLPPTESARSGNATAARFLSDRDTFWRASPVLSVPDSLASEMN